MEAPEVPTEHLHEEMHHHAEHEGEGAKWIMGVALSSAIIAGMAAIASLLAGVHDNKAMIDQMRASDSWSYYQAKGVKSNVLSSKIELLTALGKTPDKKDTEKIPGYKKDQERISEKAHEFEEASTEHLEIHESFARSVTLFQVAIALAAVSVLTKRRGFWFVSLAGAAVGAYFLGEGVMAGNAQKEPVPLTESAGGGEGKAHEGKAHEGHEKKAEGEKKGEGEPAEHPAAGGAEETKPATAEPAGAGEAKPKGE